MMFVNVLQNFVNNEEQKTLSALAEGRNATGRERVSTEKANAIPDGRVSTCKIKLILFI
jgi:hypothetical protein